MRVVGRIVHAALVTSCPFDRFNLFKMKSKFLLSTVCFLIASSMTAFAQDLNELVTQLDSDQMNHRTEARNSIQQLLTSSTAPTADANVRRVLARKLAILQSDLSRPLRSGCRECWS